ncbi:helix-turn-helix transcriptional regulator [Thalassotalea litorea]|uniref:Helix-turn-helix transcriptional regulator n=1 Tax=Thalassotalea litorea TaxID=2020715 RepID=A0A5R9ID21_9GAMM|nr:AraC family transcriptional regulator [Thalassotalea litorea]TLU61481.1 helix-turn-helix transcriptional regulator [Thalassotalea litorea]
MLSANQTGALLLVAFDEALANDFCETVNVSCQVLSIPTMQSLENFLGNPKSVVYLMNHINTDHLHNIEFITQKFAGIGVVVFSQSLSIPLLQHAIHCGVRELYLYPPSELELESYLSVIGELRSADAKYSRESTLVDISAIRSSKWVRYGAVVELLELIEKNFSHASSLQDFSHDIHLSQSRLSHMFKDVTGMNFSHYLICRRLEEAERILTSESASSTTIAFELGFSNPSHFCRVFKEHFGLSPMAYSEDNRTMQNSETYLHYLRLRCDLLNTLNSLSAGNVNSADKEKAIEIQSTRQSNRSVKC